MPDYSVHLRKPHLKQAEFIHSPAKRKIIRAGRRSGKTTGIARLASEAFLKGRRVLYAAPTSEQVAKFWNEVLIAFDELIRAKVLYKNETEHILEWTGQPANQARIRAKTAWNADTLRGDYADLLILDEYQLMSEDAWEFVGAPMLADNDGDAVFIYTPPSIRSNSVSKARDKKHASKMFKEAEKDDTGFWATFHFTSWDNPHVSAEGLKNAQKSMTTLAYRQEMLADDDVEIAGALWTYERIDLFRVHHPDSIPRFARIAIAIDPAVTATAGSDETGLIAGALGEDGHGYILRDLSGKFSPNEWAGKAVDWYKVNYADCIIAEVNNGGDMVVNTILTQDAYANVKQVRASTGKLVRAEPIAALAEQGLIHMIGTFPELEEQLCSWVQGDKSPDRLDAYVWLFTELMLNSGNTWQNAPTPADKDRQDAQRRLRRGR